MLTCVHNILTLLRLGMGGGGGRGGKCPRRFQLSRTSLISNPIPPGRGGGGAAFDARANFD